GTLWGQDQFRDRLMHDMKASGAVVGTTLDDRYVHTAGDGSYTISDYDYSLGNDHLEFSDQTREDIQVRRDGLDVSFHLANGEVITVLGQLNSNQRSSIESIEFADGTIWDQQALLDAIVHDMKASGSVEGSHWSETHRHSLGDGSYSITSPQNLSGQNDKLVFTDATADQALITRDGENAVITLANGEQVVLVGYFLSDPDKRIASVEFSDGVVFTDLETLQPVEGAYIKGTVHNEYVIGTSGDNILHGLTGDDHLRGGEGADTYRYSLGDGD
ncbi:calcium-binding protein, partial [Ruegeria atlantica]|uniref:calcium-binding protein n=1 Tax=Ruegeria atlantica TaxID=81569 RepID=UPI002494505C